MGLKLYYHPLSTYSRRVRIAFAEKQIPHELVVVDLAARRHREQPYLSLNPYGRVPTLEEDGFVLFESTAILNYLEATRPTPPLLPADAHGRALVDMHMKLCDLQLTRHTGTIIFPKRFLPKEKWNTVAMAEAKTEIEKHFAILNQHLDDLRWNLKGKVHVVFDLAIRQLQRRFCPSSGANEEVPFKLQRHQISQTNGDVR